MRSSLLVRAWLVTAVVDFCFASALGVVAYHSSVARVWKGVASTVLGAGALQGGARAFAVGVVLHLSVALVWTSLFVALVASWPRLRAAMGTPAGVVAVSAIYGPLIWCAMSIVVIPRFTGRPPTFAPRWWVQLVAHAAFVALPMVTTIARELAPRIDARAAAAGPGT
jgi:uncharacterized membrane protein YagU involved in acid resistance